MNHFSVWEICLHNVIFSIWWQGKDKHKLKVLNNYINKKETQGDQTKN